MCWIWYISSKQTGLTFFDVVYRIVVPLLGAEKIQRIIYKVTTRYCIYLYLKLIFITIPTGMHYQACLSIQQSLRENLNQFTEYGRIRVVFCWLRLQKKQKMFFLHAAGGTGGWDAWCRHVLLLPAVVWPVFPPTHPVYSYSQVVELNHPVYS